MSDEPKQFVDYSEAIAKGVFNWLEANKDSVLDIIKASTGAAVEMMGAGTMAAVNKFLDQNGNDLRAAIASAIAASFVSRDTKQWKG